MKTKSKLFSSGNLLSAIIYHILWYIKSQQLITFGKCPTEQVQKENSINRALGNKRNNVFLCLLVLNNIVRKLAELGRITRG